MIARFRIELNQIIERIKELCGMCIPQLDSSDAVVQWKTLSRTFLKLGFTGFGGGIAVIGQIRRIVVRQNRCFQKNNSWMPFLWRKVCLARTQRTPLRISG